MPQRHWYVFDFTTHEPDPPSAPSDELTILSPDEDDRLGLAGLMLDAYAGTIDDDGGVIEDAVVEMDNYLRGEYGVPLLDVSRIALDADGGYASAILITRWGRQDLPLVAFAMTAPAWQGKGIGLLLLQHSLAALAASGERAIRAVITEGNFPSERLFAKGGFRKVEPAQ